MDSKSLCSIDDAGSSRSNSYGFSERAFDIASRERGDGHFRHVSISAISVVDTPHSSDSFAWESLQLLRAVFMFSASIFLIRSIENLFPSAILRDCEGC